MGIPVFFIYTEAYITLLRRYFDTYRMKKRVKHFSLLRRYFDTYRMKKRVKHFSLLYISSQEKKCQLFMFCKMIPGTSESKCVLVYTSAPMSQTTRDASNWWLLLTAGSSIRGWGSCGWARQLGRRGWGSCGWARRLGRRRMVHKLNVSIALFSGDAALSHQ